MEKSTSLSVYQGNQKRIGSILAHAFHQREAQGIMSANALICDNLQNAVWDLEELTEAEAHWWLCTCYHCHYGDYNRLHSLSDREYACYRDVPEALAEIRAKGRIASPEARRVGKYFVDAFHTCAAWKPTHMAPAAEEPS